MVEDIKNNLILSFNNNPNFDAQNIGKDNTVEDKIFAYAIKISSQFKISLANFYDKMKTFRLRSLSTYANKGFISYNSIENEGYISELILKQDDNNDFNVDNLFTQIMLMVTASKDNYYGFENESALHALNDACTYMIASNLSSSANKNYLEEELNSLNQLDIILSGSKAKIDFINAYFTNNGTLLKEELNKYGIDDDLLNQINYLYQSKLSNLNIPELYAKIENKINRNFAMLVSNGVISSRDLIDKYKSHLLGDQVFDYSSINLDNVCNNTILALNEINKRNQSSINNLGNSQVMSKTT